MKVQGRRKRGRPKRRWLDKVKDGRAIWRRMSSYIDTTYKWDWGEEEEEEEDESSV